MLKIHTHTHTHMQQTFWEFWLRLSEFWLAVILLVKKKKKLTVSMLPQYGPTAEIHELQTTFYVYWAVLVHPRFIDLAHFLDHRSVNKPFEGCILSVLSQWTNHWRLYFVCSSCESAVHIGCVYAGRMSAWAGMTVRLHRFYEYAYFMCLFLFVSVFVVIMCLWWDVFVCVWWGVFQGAWGGRG